jgi:hypothetical protein
MSGGFIQTSGLHLRQHPLGFAVIRHAQGKMGLEATTGPAAEAAGQRRIVATVWDTLDEPGSTGSAAELAKNSREEQS